MTVQSSSGVLVDKVLNERFPDSTIHLFRENKSDGRIEFTLVVRSKTHMTTHRSDVTMDGIYWHEDEVRAALLANMREL